MPQKPPKPQAFKEAVDWFLARVPMLREEAEQLRARTEERAFYVSGVAQLRLAGELHQAITKAIAKGTTLEDFKRDAGQKLIDEWGGEIPGRMETIFRTNVQAAYNAGRLEQFEQPLMKKLRPYRAWSVILDSRTTEDICRPLAKVIVPADSAFAASHIPPLHFQCRTGLMSLSPEQAGEEGGVTEELPETEVAEGFGGDPRKPLRLDVSQEPRALVKELGKKLENAPALVTPPGRKDVTPPVVEDWPQGRVQGTLASEVERLYPGVARALGAKLRVDGALEGAERRKALEEVRGLMRMPPDLLQVIGRSLQGIHVGPRSVAELGTGRLSKTVRKANAGLQDDRTSWAQLNGAFVHGGGGKPEVLVNTKVESSGVLAHELGHALDHEVLRGASAHPEFRAAWSAFKRSSLPNAKDPYFTGDATAGPSETFAEAFNELMRKGRAPAERSWGKAIIDVVSVAADAAASTLGRAK